MLNEIAGPTKARLWHFLKSNNTKKTNTTVELLGCTPEFLRNYIEQKFTSEMSWDNYDTYWDLDHIYPLSKANLNDPNELKRVCHYTNLQPLNKIENIRKGSSVPENFVWSEGCPNDEK